MVLFAHLKSDSSLFFTLPFEIIYFIFTFVTPVLSKNSNYFCSQIFKQNKDGQDLFETPYGLKRDILTKQMYVCSYCAVRVFDKDFSVLYEFGGPGTEKGQFSEPLGIDISTKSQKVYVSDPTNHRVQSFNTQGKFLSASGTEKPSDGSEWTPHSLSVSEIEEIFVTDLNSHRVQVLNENCEFLYSFGHLGLAEPRHEYLDGISVSKCSDKVFVSDSGNSKIHAYSQKGLFLFSFGGPGGDNGLFGYPTSIHVDVEDHVFIADTDENRIQIFDANGTFLLSFGSEAETPDINDFTVDEEGNVFVCNYDSNCIGLWKYY